jgi:hypothetical protein
MCPAIFGAQQSPIRTKESFLAATGQSSRVIREHEPLQNRTKVEHSFSMFCAPDLSSYRALLRWAFPLIQIPHVPFHNLSMPQQARAGLEGRSPIEHESAASASPFQPVFFPFHKLSAAAFALHSLLEHPCEKKKSKLTSCTSLHKSIITFQDLLVASRSSLSPCARLLECPSIVSPPFPRRRGRGRRVHFGRKAQLWQCALGRRSPYRVNQCERVLAGIS